MLCDHIEYVIALGILGFSIFSFLHLEKKLPQSFQCLLLFRLLLFYDFQCGALISLVKFTQGGKEFKLEGYSEWDQSCQLFFN